MEEASPPAGRLPGRPPGLRQLLGRGLTLACPACGARGHFRRWVRMAERCHRCRFIFERIEGHWLGAIGINTIVTFGALATWVIGALVVTAPDPPTLALTLGNIAVAGLVPLVFYPFSRTLWTAVDVAMRPLEAHEVDWTKVGWEHS